MGRMSLRGRAQSGTAMALAGTIVCLGAAPAGALPASGARCRRRSRVCTLTSAARTRRITGSSVACWSAVRERCRWPAPLLFARPSPGRGAGPQIMAGPTGLGPTQIQSAYKLTGLSSGGRTVAIVDAFDDPKAESDLATFRRHTVCRRARRPTAASGRSTRTAPSSPLPAATTAGPRRSASTSTPSRRPAPTATSCSSRRTRRNTRTSTRRSGRRGGKRRARRDLEQLRRRRGLIAARADAHFNHPGVAITASSGDSGYGVSWPASSPYVTGVGGTTLSNATTRAAGPRPRGRAPAAAARRIEPKPAWQHDPGCAKRTVADVSADADPNTGLGVYDTYNSCGSSSFCDTADRARDRPGPRRLGAGRRHEPQLAADRVGLRARRQHRSVTYGSFPTATPASLFDVTSGSNGSCGGPYLCTAGAGYDGPTGLGTPNGVGGF